MALLSTLRFASGHATDGKRGPGRLVLAAAVLAALLGALAGSISPASALDPGATQAVPGTVQLFGVACPSATTCEAVGLNSASNEGVVVTITSGTPGTVQAVSGTSDLF
ncbi:MAG TPA: hypothetical protein VK386_07680, partial [Acidimicrobiales bacterium]|nr:hypothetical protein [Acidimicrobiales bacterium]